MVNETAIETAELRAKPRVKAAPSQLDSCALGSTPPVLAHSSYGIWASAGGNRFTGKA